MGKRIASCEFYIFISIAASLGWIGVQLRSLPLLVIAIAMIMVGILVAVTDYYNDHKESKGKRKMTRGSKYDSGLELE